MPRHFHLLMTKGASVTECEIAWIQQKRISVAFVATPEAPSDSVAAAETLVSKCSITAPFAGVTVDEKMHAFEYATPGRPVIEVMDDRALEVDLAVPVRWLGWLRPGTPFQFRVDETGKTYPAKFVRIGGRADSVSHSVEAVGGGHR